MATIVTRSGKGSPLSIAEGDANFTNLNNDKVELDDISVTTGSPSGAGALSYNNTTGAFTFNPVDVSLVLEVLEDDTAPALGGNLDVNSYSITTTQANGSIQLSPNGTGIISLSANTNVNGHLTIQGSNALQSELNNDLNLNATGTGNISLVGTEIDINQPIVNFPNGVAQITASNSVDLVTDTMLVGASSSSTEALITTAANSNCSLKLRGNGTGMILLDDPVALVGGDLDVGSQEILTNVTNGNIVIQNNGTGVTSINGGSGLSIATGYLNTGTDTDLVLNPNGTGAVFVNAPNAGLALADTGSSGYGSITGAASTGIGISANEGAQAATDSKILVTSGGGLTLQAGSGSTLALSGNSITVEGTTDFNSNTVQEYVTKNYKVATYVPGGGSGVSGTYAPNWTDGSYHYLVMVGNVTINDFGGTIEAGQVIQIVKDDTVVGGNTLTFGSKFLTPGGTISQTSSGMDLYEIACIDDTSGDEVYIVRAYNNIQ